jgi:predicted short-subunit dehydrogenase-like oxidoreductase (DUF2520 family)
MTTAPRDRPGRLAVGVLGCGRVGSVLGAALLRAGHQVVAVSGVSPDSRRRAARMLLDVPVLPADEVVVRADFVLLAVPDDALAPLVAGLAETGRWRAGQLVAHVSGAYGLAVLDRATRDGALPLALHPVLPFTGRGADDLARLAGVSFGVSAPEPLRLVAEALVVEMGGEPVWVSDAMRPLWHAALTIGANHLTTLVNEAADLLRAAGVAEPGKVLGPMMGAALDGALRYGDQALTGPVSRGDAGTVAKHLAALARSAPDATAAYVALARQTADRALSSGQLRPEQAETLLDVLSAPRTSA